MATAHNLKGYFPEREFSLWESIGEVLIFFALQRVEKLNLGVFFAGNHNSLFQGTGPENFRCANPENLL
jgi:hypothetical protein